MMKLAICLLALAACGLPDKTHCATSNDCLDGDVCRSGTCGPPIDGECGTTGKVCGTNAACSDAGGGLACSCSAGYDGDGVTCSDVNECAAADSPCADHAACLNSPGAFSCSCVSGFTGDGSTYCAPRQFVKIAAAGGFSCGVAGDGGMYCWGVNVHGSLGNPDLSSRAHPTQVGSDTDWIDVAARVDSACGRRADHSMWCWGLGTEGQLGDGGLKNEYAPVRVVSDKPGVGWKKMALGRQTACAIHDDGTLACWGLNREQGATHPFPLPITGQDTDWTAISVGTVRCAIRTAGTLWCWGSSSHGDLGLGTQTLAITPTQIGTDTWKAVSVGYYNTCAIRSDGALFCWGKNPVSESLQYGNTPTRIGTATDWEQISVANNSVIGLRNGGHAYGWGGNDTGQVGQPLALTVFDPAPISGDVAVWSQISAGNVHGCGVSAGQAYCWGLVSDGILGTGPTTARLIPTRIGETTWSSLATDASRQCGIRTDGALLCRGYNVDLGVGFGDTAPVWAPVQIGTDTWSSVSGSSSILDVAMCAIRGGAPYCWGSNTTGQIGIGTSETPQLRPVAVKLPPGMQWSEIAIGDHICAISSEGLMYCWGANDTGQLGAGFASSEPRLAPTTPVEGTWLHVGVVGHDVPGGMTCGIKANHTLWCWGQDQPPATTQHVSPTQVGIDDTWASLSLGAPLNNATNHAATICAIKANHTLWCFGTQLGNGTQDSSPSPVQVGTAADWKSVTVGREICAIKTGGTLWCWANSDLLGAGAPIDYDAENDAATQPTQIGTDTDWTTVTTNGRNCGTKTSGAMFCWGYLATTTPDIVTVPVPLL